MMTNILRYQTCIATVWLTALVGAGTFVAFGQEEPPEPELSTASVASNKYGSGGTLESSSDARLKLFREIWKDRNGRVREMHAFRYRTPEPGKPDIPMETWRFFKDGIEIAIFAYLPAPSNEFRRLKPDPSDKTSVSKADVEKWIEEIEQQFVRDGTIPAPSSKKETEAETKKETMAVVSNDVVGTTKVDPCLVGTWTLQPDDSAGIYQNGGLVFTIEKNGDATFDYTGLKEFVETVQFVTNGIKFPYRTDKMEGKATGKISGSGGMIKVIGTPTVNVKLTVKEEDKDSAPPTVTNYQYFLPTESSTGATYTCNGNTLTLGSLKFKK